MGPKSPQNYTPVPVGPVPVGPVPVRRRVFPLPDSMAVKPHWRTLRVIGMLLSLPACSIPGPQTGEDDMATLSRRSVTLPALPPATEEAVTISYLDGGDPNGPRVIYVHGTPGNAEGWADYIMAPQAEMKAIAIDRPGFGQSGPDGSVPSLQAQAAALEPFLEARRGVAPILVGHSLGGPIVARAAIDFPDKVGGLVIVAGSLDPDLEEIHPMQYVGEWLWVRPLLPRAIRNSNQELLALEDELRLMAERLGEIKVPVAIVHGTDDNLVPFDNVAFMERTLTGAAMLEIMVLTGQNHFLPWNSKPVIDEAVAIVRDAIEKPAGDQSAAPSAEPEPE